MDNRRSIIATPPGATIREVLHDRGMKQKEFAVRMNMTEKHISRLINGEVQLTPDVSVRLEMVLGIPAKFWNNLEAIYREKLIKLEMEEAAHTDAEIMKKIPYTEISKYGWIDIAKNDEEKIERLRKYFEIVELSLLDNRQIMKVACHQLAVTEKNDLALLTWVQRAKLITRETSVSPINIKGIPNNMSDIKRIARSKPAKLCDKLNAILGQYGIVLVFLPRLKDSLLQGATFMDGNKIIIVLAEELIESDDLEFNLYHELAHIVLGHITQDNGTTELDEKAADEWAISNVAE